MEDFGNNKPKLQGGITMEKVICFDARNIKTESDILQLVYSLNYQYIFIKVEQYETLKAPHKMKCMVYMSEYKDIGNQDNIIIVSDNIQVLDVAKEKYNTALYCLISNSTEMDAAWNQGQKYPFLIVEFVDETNIPLELLIAKLQGEKTVILKMVKNYQEALVAMKVMEKGSEGVILSTDRSEDILEVDKYVQSLKMMKIELSVAKVTSIEHIEMGFRACVDTTSIMTKCEGMIVGSTSRGGLLVSSETHYLPYMVTRPFRVNAGAVHSYIFTPNGETQYLSELKSGSVVTIVDTKGNTRPASVGRMKIEVRPLLKIEAEVSGVAISAIVQDDWHIRIFEIGRAHV